MAAADVVNLLYTMTYGLIAHALPGVCRRSAAGAYQGTAFTVNVHGNQA
jgi:hypothetical protein